MANMSGTRTPQQVVIGKAHALRPHNVEELLAEVVISLGEDLPVSKMAIALIWLINRSRETDSRVEDFHKKVDAILRSIANQHADVRDYLKGND